MYPNYEIQHGVPIRVSVPLLSVSDGKVRLKRMFKQLFTYSGVVLRSSGTYPPQCQHRGRQKLPLFPLAVLQSRLPQGPGAWNGPWLPELNSSLFEQVPNVINDQQHGTGPLREREHSCSAQQQATKLNLPKHKTRFRLSISPPKTFRSNLWHSCVVTKGPEPPALPILASPEHRTVGDWLLPPGGCKMLDF